MAVLDRIMAAAPDDPEWGLRICEREGLGPGTVYPILERLTDIGWIEASWELEQPSGRPSRRYYHITGKGRVEYAKAKSARDARRAKWRARSAHRIAGWCL